MSEQPTRNLSIYTPRMGYITLQPKVSDVHDIEKSDLVLFPERMDEQSLNVIVDWAAGTQTPIFCHKSDIAQLESMGFGAYRFHALDGFKEVDFQGGTVDFYPAKRPKKRGISGFVIEFLEKFGVLKTPSFHVLIKPKKEKPILFLTGTHIDAVEWSLWMKEDPLVRGYDLQGCG